MRHFLIALVAAIILTAVPAAPSRAAAGLHLLGFESMDQTNRNEVIRLIREAYAAGVHSVEVEVLPFEFARNGDFFANTTALAHDILPRLKGGQTLRLSIVLRHHDKGFTDSTTALNSPFWLSWARYNTAHDTGNAEPARQFLENRVGPADAWAKSLREWAVSNKTASNLGITFILENEDTCVNATTYSKALSAVRARQNQDRLTSNTLFRRSAGVAVTRISTATLETHLDAKEAARLLRSGDYFSNDGIQLSATGWNQMAGILPDGVVRGAWRESYNGLGGGVTVSTAFANRHVAPFTDPRYNPDTERDFIRRALRM